MKRALRALFAVLALGLLLWTALRQGRDVLDAAADLPVAGMVLGLAVLVAAQVFSMLAWRSLLAGLGSSLPPRAAARVFWLGQLGKYVPGSVWPVVAQVELARDHGVPRKRSTAAALFAMAVGLLTGLLLAGLLLPAGDGRLASPLWLLLVPPSLVCLVEPRLLVRSFGLALRVIRRQPMAETLPRRALLTATGWALAMWACFGAHVALLAPGVGFLDALGVFASAWCAGFLVLLAPAGAGFRETVLAYGLTLPAASGAAVALASRLLMTLSDLVVVGIAFAVRDRDQAGAA